MPTTTNYGWTTPADTDLVKDGASAIRTLGTAIDTTVFNNASAAIAKTIVDAKGDIIAATAADTVSRLAVGANDTVLTADSSTATGLKWATAAAGGMTLISTTSLSGTTTTLSSIPGTYNSLHLVIFGLTTSAGNDEPFTCSPNNVNNLTDQTGVNQAAFVNTQSSQIQLTGGQSTLRTNANNVWVLKIDNYASATSFKPFELYGHYATGASTRGSIIIGGAFRSTTAITSLVFNYASSNMNAGTILLYGVK